MFGINFSGVGSLIYIAVFGKFLDKLFTIDVRILGEDSKVCCMIM